MLLFGALAAMVSLADQSTQLNPDFLSEVVLYALSAADLTMLRRAGVRAGAQHRQAGRRAAPRAAVLALPRQAGAGAARADDRAVGARADRRQRADSQQRPSAGSAQPIDDVLRSANEIAGDYYRERRSSVGDHAQRIAASAAGAAVAAGDVDGGARGRSRPR